MDIVELQGIFEYELKRKLAQRSRSPQEELRKLISAFKFFDYTSSFILDKNQWIKGVLRTGLCGFNIKDLSKVFERYDPNKSGYINYINFSNHIYGKEELIPLDSNFEDDIINNKNITINNRGNNNEFKPPGLYERNYDNEVKQNQLSHYNNSESSLNDFNLNNNNNSNVNNINNDSKNNNNNINEYNNAPKQNNYHMSKSQSQKVIPSKNNISNINMNNNVVQNISNINIDDKIKNNVNDNNNSNNSNNNIPENKNYFQKLINIFRNKININNGITYYTFAHALKSLEDKNTHSISIEKLLSVFEQLEININQDDLINFYSILDYTQSNKVLTDEILRIIKGEIPEQRKILIVSKFALMDKEKTGIVPINLVKQLYNAKFHPDAFLGKKSVEDVYKEFLYTFDIFCELNGLKDEISFKEFIDYYIPISASILNDNYFDDIVYGVWNIEEKTNENNNNISNNNNLNENKIIDNKNDYNYNEDNIQIDKRNNFQIKNNYNSNLSKSQNINMGEQMRPFSPPTNNEESIKKQRMTPYYNPRASPEGKGIKMFRQLRFNPITNEYIMSPMTPEKNINNQNYNNYNNDMNMNSNYLDNSTNNNNNLNSNTGINKIDLLRNLLAKRGKKSIFIIQRMFYIYDRSQTGEIPFEKLCDIFEIYNINLTKEEIFEFFNILDKEHKGIIKYNNLIQILIDNINQNREILIQKLFERFNINGFVLINDLKQSFNPMKHPDVINQIKNKEEIFLDFIDSLEIFREYNGNLNNENIKSGYMSYEDFSNFFKEISMSILDDKYFEYFINNCFYDKNLENKNNYGYGNDNVRIRAGKQIINNV